MHFRCQSFCNRVRSRNHDTLSEKLDNIISGPLHDIQFSYEKNFSLGTRTSGICFIHPGREVRKRDWNAVFINYVKNELRLIYARESRSLSTHEADSSARGWLISTRLTHQHEADLSARGWLISRCFLRKINWRDRSCTFSLLSCVMASWWLNTVAFPASYSLVLFAFVVANSDFCGSVFETQPGK